MWHSWIRGDVVARHRYPVVDQITNLSAARAGHGDSGHAHSVGSKQSVHDTGGIATGRNAHGHVARPPQALKLASVDVVERKVVGNCGEG